MKACQNITGTIVNRKTKLKTKKIHFFFKIWKNLYYDTNKMECKDNQNQMCINMLIEKVKKMSRIKALSGALSQSITKIN